MFLAFGMVAAACGGGTKKGAATSPSATAALATTAPATTGPPCTPSGTTLQIATDVPSPSYDRDCLAAPADAAFKIDFSNRDPGVQHNVSIYTNAGASTVLFKGKVVTGPKEITYDVKALPAGTYYFRCDIHPFGSMKGTFVVSG